METYSRERRVKLEEIGDDVYVIWGWAVHSRMLLMLVQLLESKRRRPRSLSISRPTLMRGSWGQRHSVLVHWYSYQTKRDNQLIALLCSLWHGITATTLPVLLPARASHESDSAFC